MNQILSRLSSALIKIKEAVKSLRKQKHEAEPAEPVSEIARSGKEPELDLDQKIQEPYESQASAETGPVTGEEEEEKVEGTVEETEDEAIEGTPIPEPEPAPGDEAHDPVAAPRVINKEKIQSAIVRTVRWLLVPLALIKALFTKRRIPYIKYPTYSKPRSAAVKRLIKAVQILFLTACLASGLFVGWKLSRGMVNSDPAPSPETQVAEPEKLPAAPAKNTEREAPRLPAPRGPVEEPPEKPASETAKPSGPSPSYIIDLPEKGKYDEPPYSKDIYGDKL